MSRSYGGIPPLRGIEIVAGVYSNIQGEGKIGHALALGTSDATIWTPATIYSYPSGATAMTISSDSTDDDAGGIGALTARVTGLDDAWLEVQETLTLDGQVGVAIPTSLRRSYCVEILTAGSNDGNVGTVYVGSGAITAGVPANVFAQADPELNRSLMTPFTVPAGKTGYVTAVYASLGGATDLDIHLFVREPGEVFRARRDDHVRSAPFFQALDLPIGPIPPMSDIEIRGSVVSSTIDVAAGYDVVLIED